MKYLKFKIDSIEKVNNLLELFNIEDKKLEELIHHFEQARLTKNKFVKTNDYDKATVFRNKEVYLMCQIINTCKKLFETKLFKTNIIEFDFDAYKKIQDKHIKKEPRVLGDFISDDE